MKSEVIIALDVEGFHNYPDAPKQVEFLSFPHRHTFKIKAGFKVDDLNREKEIFIERDRLKQYFFDVYGSPAQFGAMSCEMIAADLLEVGKLQGMFWVEVWEEETGGAKVILT